MDQNVHNSAPTKRIAIYLLALGALLLFLAARYSSVMSLFGVTTGKSEPAPVILAVVGVPLLVIGILGVSGASRTLRRWSDPVYCLMRLFVGVMFACHGAQKVFGMLGGKVASGGMYSFGWLELICGVLIAIGLLTRVGALLGSGLMAIAYFKTHASGGFFPIVNHGELAVVYCWLFLFILFYGPGRWSLDALIRKPAEPIPAAA